MKNKKMFLILILFFCVTIIAILFLTVFNSSNEIYKINSKNLQTTKEESIGSLEGKIVVENYTNGYNAVISAFLINSPETVVEQVTSADDGSFIMYFASAGEYIITIEQPGCMMYKATNFKIENDQKLLLLNINLINGDLNNDKEIEIMDLTALNDNLSISSNNKYDLNKDGKVDEKDKEIVKNNYGKKMDEQIAEYVQAEGYGVRRASTTSITTTAWERVGDSEGLVANATKLGVSGENDFDTLYPWNAINSYNYDVSTKTITAWYGDSNFKFDGSNGEVLTYIPEFYYKREVVVEDGIEYEYNYISEYPLIGYSKSEAFSVGRYEMSTTIDKVGHSKNMSILTLGTHTTLRNYAKALGPEFGMLDYRYFLIRMLYLVEYADYDAQSILGRGYTNMSSTSRDSDTGSCDKLGMKSGSIGDGTQGREGVIYRGLENFFGNAWECIDGINVTNRQIWFCKDPTQYDTNIFEAPYQKLGYVNSTSAGNMIRGGYDSENCELVFPIEVTNNSTMNIYSSDWYSQATGTASLYVGGGYQQGGYAGPWCIALYESPLSSSSVTARLLKFK